MPQQAEIKIIVDPSTGQVSYQSPLSVPATVFYLQFVMFDLMSRFRTPEKPGNIVVPQIVPPARPEG